MKKLLCLLLAAALLTGILAGCGNNSDGTEPSVPEGSSGPATEPNDPGTTPGGTTSGGKIKLGVVATLAADGKISGYYFEIGLRLVKKMFADAGLDENSVEFVLRDQGEDGSVLKQRMTELKEAGCVGIIAAIADDFGPVAAQWAGENSVPVLFCSNYSTEMTITNYSDYIFGTGLNAWGFIKVLAQEAVGKRGIKNYAYVGTDGAGAADAENILLYEGQKINPDFHCVASYRMSQTETDFSTIIATLMSQEEKPQMTLQQGGNAVISFVMQAGMYDYYSISSVWSDVIIMPFVVPTLVNAGVYNFDGSFGATPLAWWDDDFADYCEAFRTVGKEVYDTDYQPVEYSMYLYWAGEALLNAIQTARAENIDITDGQVLKGLLENVSFTDFGSEHHFRDFDHQLTMDLFFVDAVDSGEEHDHLAMPADVTAVHSADDYLPTMEEMKTYGIEKLGVTDRFD